MIRRDHFPLPMPHRCLMISLEKGLFDPKNRARKRIANYGSFLERLDIIVLGTQPYADFIAPNVHVTSTHSRSRYFYLLDALRLIWSTRTEHYDVVISQDLAEMGLIAYLAARLHSAAFAPNDVGYFFHGEYFSRESIGNRLRTVLGMWLLKKIDAIRVMSERSERMLVQEQGIDPKAIIRYPFDVDEQFFQPAPSFSKEELARTQGRPYFLVPARFVPIKRIDLTIRAFAKIAQKHVTPLLVLVGQGPLRNNLEALAQELHVEDRVVWIEWTQAMATWYTNALATVITSDREGYAMTALESLLCHTPVLMTDVGCAGEIVHDQVNGYIVPVGDQEAIANAMEQILTETHPLKAGANAFTYPTPAQGTSLFIERAIERKRAKTNKR